MDLLLIHILAQTDEQQPLAIQLQRYKQAGWTLTTYYL